MTLADKLNEKRKLQVAPNIFDFYEWYTSIGGVIENKHFDLIVEKFKKNR